jgi:hypothetical protein
MSASSKPATTMVSVYDGQECLGFVLRRHWSNGLAIAYEAFDVSGERSLGIFETQDAAAAEVWRRAQGQASTPPAVVVPR